MFTVRLKEKYISFLSSCKIQEITRENNTITIHLPRNKFRIIPQQLLGIVELLNDTPLPTSTNVENVTKIKDFLIKK